MPQEGAAIGRIDVTPGGPCLVSGGVPLATPTRVIPTNEVYTLCRCGHSSRKPFCDGTHARVGFDGTGTAEGPGIDLPDGAGCGIQVRDDGPLAVVGVALRHEDGAPAAGDRFTLCRCGASATKPFCDGSHREVGFRA